MLLISARIVSAKGSAFLGFRCFVGFETVWGLGLKNLGLRMLETIYNPHLKAQKVLIQPDTLNGPKPQGRPKPLAVIVLLFKWTDGSQNPEP